MDGMTRGQRLLSVLWAAFLMAGVLEMIVFAHVDPGALHWFGGSAMDLEPRAVYTLAFFVFWAVISVACGLALLLCSRAEEINRSRMAGRG
jgi:NO-binding membrane sensor protein with MHYT domain